MMKNSGLQIVLKKLAAAAMAVAVMGTGMAVPKADGIQAPETEVASVQSYHETVVNAINPAGPNYRTVNPVTGVVLLISTTCKNKDNNWIAQMSGDKSDSYTGGSYSFGYNGKSDNKEIRTPFASFHKYKNISDTNKYDNTMAKLYYND